MAAVYWRDLRFLVHFRKSHPVVIAFFARREFISIRIVSIVTYQKKKKKILAIYRRRFPWIVAKNFNFGTRRLEFLKIPHKSSSRVWQNFFSFFLNYQRIAKTLSSSPNLSIIIHTYTFEHFLHHAYKLEILDPRHYLE